MKKRMAMLVLASAMVMTSLTGCGLKDDDTVATVAGEEIPAGLANFYARMTQAQYESIYSAYLGEDMWTQTVTDGETYESMVKEQIIEDLENMYLMEDHMEDYGVTLSDDEKAAIAEAAEKFDQDNEAEAKEKVSGDQEYVERYLTLVTIQDKVTKAIEAEADTNVSDEEAKQKSMQYVLFSFTTTDDDGNSVTLTDEEKEELKAEAETFAASAVSAEDFSAYATEQGYEATEATFDSEGSASLPQAVTDAADELDEGGVTECIEASNGYYVAKLTSLFDEEATETEKQNIIAQRKQDKYDEVIESWRAEAEISVKKSVWKKVDFKELKVTLHTEESDTSTDTTENE